MIWLFVFSSLLLLSCLAKRHKNIETKHYYICSRKAGAIAVSFSLLASCIGGSATLGMIGLAWQIGAPAFWWLGSGSAGLLILGFLLARKVRSSRAKTMPEILAKQLGPSFRSACAIIIVIAYVPIMAAQFNAQALLISSISGLEHTQVLLPGALALFAYTAIGGQNAVMKSDIWQLAIVICTVALVLIFCLSMPQGRAAVSAAPLELVNDRFPALKLVYFLFILGGSFIVGPVFYGRLLSAKSQSTAKKSCIAAAAVLAAIAAAITAVGIALNGILPPVSFENGFKADSILDVFVREKMPSWTVGPILLGMLSAVVSSADSCLFTAGSVAANDLLKRPGISACRLSMAALVIASCFLALNGHGILNLLLMANDIYVCGIVPPVFVAILYGYKRKPQRGFMLAALIFGGCSGAAAAWLQNECISLFALGSSLLLSLLGVWLPKTPALRLSA